MPHRIAAKYETLSPTTRILGGFITMIIIFTLILGSYAWISVSNKHNIANIQKSRVESCKDTYRAFNKVFEPFLPAPTDRSEEQQKNITQLHLIVEKLVRGCEDQVSPANTTSN